MKKGSVCIMHRLSECAYLRHTINPEHVVLPFSCHRFTSSNAIHVVISKATIHVYPSRSHREGLLPLSRRNSGIFRSIAMASRKCQPLRSGFLN